MSGGVKIFCSEELIVTTLLRSKDMKLFLDQHDPQRRHWDQFWAWDPKQKAGLYSGRPGGRKMFAKKRTERVGRISTKAVILHGGDASLYTLIMPTPLIMPKQIIVTSRCFKLLSLQNATLQLAGGRQFVFSVKQHTDDHSIQSIKAWSSLLLGAPTNNNYHTYMGIPLSRPAFVGAVPRATASWTQTTWLRLPPS